MLNWHMKRDARTKNCRRISQGALRSCKCLSGAKQRQETQLASIACERHRLRAASSHLPKLLLLTVGIVSHELVRPIELAHGHKPAERAKLARLSK